MTEKKKHLISSGVPRFISLSANCFRHIWLTLKWISVEKLELKKKTSGEKSSDSANGREQKAFLLAEEDEDEVGWFSRNIEARELCVTIPLPREREKELKLSYTIFGYFN